MRPIDADELKKEVLKWMPSDPCGIEEKEFPFETDIVVSLMMEIEEAPTIEPKRGKWIYQFRDSENEEYRCSECGYPQAVKVNFCPNCGADMRKGADDE